MAQNAFEQNIKTVVMVGVHEDCLYGKLQPDGHHSTAPENKEDPPQETMKEYLYKQVDDEGNKLILSIEHTT